ncbi:MAG: hypothetical protein RIC95_15485 [Vicingaceae bacterium]
MKIAIQLVLLAIAAVLSYLIYDGIQNKIEFQKEAESRREIVQERLLNVVEAQKEFKTEKGRYANSFNELIGFLESDSLTIVKAIGSVPDTMTEVEAVKQGIVIRDTALVPASTIFPEGFAFDSLRYVPFSGGSEFKIKADVIEKNKVNVNVFETYTTLGEVYKGLNTKSENVDLDDRLQVGSLTEPITSGNW